MLVADRIGKMQRMRDSLSETCNGYGMEINVKKTKVMMVGDTGEARGVQRDIVLNGVPLDYRECKM